MRYNILSKEFFDGYVLKFIQEHINDEGIYNYYAQRVTQKTGGISDCESAVFDYLQSNLAGKRIVHAGIGIGTLTCLLALNGRKVTGIEAGPKRMRMAELLRNNALALNADINYDLVLGCYPDTVPDDGDDCVLLFTNISAARSDDFILSAIKTFKRFGDVILDLSTFCQKRETDEQRQSLLNQILNVSGMIDNGTINNNYNYHHFRKHHEAP